MEGEEIPRKALAWGFLHTYGPCECRRFVCVRLPSYGYEYDIRRDEYGMAQRRLVYLTGYGWRVIPLFD